MLTRTITVLASVLTIASIAPSQSRIHTFDGDFAGDRLGRTVCGAGDVNGDEIPDLIVGAPDNADNGIAAGLARVLSGADGSILYTFRGAAANYRFGESVAGAGDVNGDGFDDVVIGAIGDDNGVSATGTARVYSGADGSQLRVFVGTQPFGMFGSCVAAAGDVNADGYDDVIVSAPQLFGPGPTTVFSGFDGSILRQFLAEGFGQTVAGAGDVNADGFCDVLVGSPLDATGGAWAGSVRVVSGKTWADLHRVDGAPGDLLGTAVSGAGDVNGDGHDDVIIGGSQFFNGGLGYATVLSGADWSTLNTFTGTAAGDQFGTALGGGGDVDGDGLCDVVIGAWAEDSNGVDAGSVRVYSVVSGTLLLSLTGESAGDEYGSSVAIVGDVDQDGFAEVITGAPDDDAAASDAGRAFVDSAGFTGMPGREWTYGTACPGSVGLPQIDFGGDGRMNATINIRLRGAPPMQPVIMKFGTHLVTPLDPFGLIGCTGYIRPTGLNIVAATDADGLVDFPIAVPYLPSFIGVRSDFQWIVFDAAAIPLGIVFSNALAVIWGS